METSNQAHGTTVKLLAIIGFFSILALVVWLLVQGIRLFPSAIMSLASIAETVQEYRSDNELILELQKTIVNSGETFTITWTDMGEGTYTFRHGCEDNSVLSVRTDEGTLRDLRCNEELSLPTEVHGLFIAVRTDEQRFSDVPLSVIFTPTEKGADIHVAEERVTVVNATVPSTGNGLSKETEKEEIIQTPPPSPTPTPVPAQIPLPEEGPSEAIPPPVKVPTYTGTSRNQNAQVAAPILSMTPTSFQNGFTDLRIAYQGVGTIENGSFVPKATFERGETVALRFEVKNIGTKISKDWTYSLSLPDSISYKGEVQAPLRPNERALFTVSFELSETRTQSTTVKGALDIKDDTNSSNNSFSWSVGFSN